MADPVLSVEALEKSFGALTVTDRVSLDLFPGEIHALIGPNGAGKTTLVSQIAGTLAPDEGRILLDGEDITGLSIPQRARRGLGRSFQISALAMEISALANVRMSVQARHGGSFGMIRPVAADTALRAAALAALNRAGQSDQLEDPVANLSHGARRRVELACAMASAPRCLLLDEPMAGLGPDGTQAVGDVLDSLRREVPILLIEHDMSAVFRLADRITVLVGGRVIATGSTEEIRADPAVQAAYLGTMDA
ncbi:MAG: ABC transporter ATP-binding protein [Pseudomonadota bacterium]